MPQFEIILRPKNQYANTLKKAAVAIRDRHKNSELAVPLS